MLPKMTLMFRCATAVVASVALTLCALGSAVADPASSSTDRQVVVPGHIEGTNWNRLGTWSVDYQRLAGGSRYVTDAINEIIDAEAGGIVAAIDHSATDRKPWTFTATGALSFQSIGIAELFTGVYDTELPNMPFRTVATRVFDSRTGAQIVWDNLFTDKEAGLSRLSEQTRAIIPTLYEPPRPGGWRFGPEATPNELNFKAWIPTAAGIELHFGDFQFGRLLPVITVPWSKVADLIAPEFIPLITADPPTQREESNRNHR